MRDLSVFPLENHFKRTMNLQILKPILIGAALGAALFLVPFFVLKVIVFFLLIGLIFRFFGRGRYYRGYRGPAYRGPAGWAYADKIRGMSDEDYENFKQQFGPGHRCGGARWKNDDAPSNTVAS